MAQDAIKSAEHASDTCYRIVHTGRDFGHPASARLWASLGPHPSPARQERLGRRRATKRCFSPVEGLQAVQNLQTILLEHRFRGCRLNIGMTNDLQTLTASLLANFATVRIPRCEALWTRLVADPLAALRSRSLSNAVAAETLIVRCHRGHLRGCLLEQGYRAFFDNIEGCGSDEWRLHFFSLDPAAVRVLDSVGVGECVPGLSAAFDPEKFVLHRLRQMERCGYLARTNDWWDWDSWNE